MPECVRCGAFTDAPPSGDYHYCEDCQAEFDAVRQRGVIIQQSDADGYDIFVTADSDRHDGGTESSQTDALARGKYLADELDLPVLFEYQATGSQWLLEEYLQAHPEIRRDVMERLSRVPERTDAGLLDRLRSFL